MRVRVRACACACVRVRACVCVSISVCLSVCLPVCLSVCLSVCPSLLPSFSAQPCFGFDASFRRRLCRLHRWHDSRADGASKQEREPGVAAVDATSSSGCTGMMQEGSGTNRGPCSSDRFGTLMSTAQSWLKRIVDSGTILAGLYLAWTTLVLLLSLVPNLFHWPLFARQLAQQQTPN